MKLSYFIPALLLFLTAHLTASAQASTGTIRGRVLAGGKPLELATVALPGTTLGTSTDAQLAEPAH